MRYIALIFLFTACAKPNELPVISDGDCDSFVKARVLDGTVSQYANVNSILINDQEFKISDYCRGKIEKHN